MQSADVYDNSLIIIVSDHGMGTSFSGALEHVTNFEDLADWTSSFGNFYSPIKHNVILFVKPPNEQGQAIISYDPAWNGDVRALINHYFDEFHDDSASKPIDVVVSIRANKPEVGVLFLSGTLTSSEVLEQLSSPLNQEVVYVTSLYDIPAAFAAHSDLPED